MISKTESKILNQTIRLESPVPTFAFQVIEDKNGQSGVPPSLRNKFCQVGPHSNIPPTRVEDEGKTLHYKYEEFEATLKLTRGDIWTLKFIPKLPVKNWFAFPYEDTFDYKPLGENPRVYYPFIGGVSAKLGAKMATSWWGGKYPGDIFAPFIIFASETEGVLWASSDIPRKRISLEYLGVNSKVHFIHENPHNVGEVTRYSLLVKRWRIPDNSTGSWQRGVLFYRKWMKSRFKELSTHPEWMHEIEGFISYGLQNMTKFDRSSIETTIQRAADLTNWIQFWGQMSNYAGVPKLAVPPIAANEQTSCCLPIIEIHQRYENELKKIALTHRQSGGHIGFYSRLFPNKEGNYMASEFGLSFIEKWTNYNRDTLHADVFYIDEYGRTDYKEKNPDITFYTEPFKNGTFPNETMIEGFVDIYTRPSHLGAGILSNPPSIDKTTSYENVRNFLNYSLEKGGEFDESGFRFPSLQMVRILMGNDRIGFAGYSNGDEFVSGLNFDPSPYFAERQVFLTGLKFDIGWQQENGASGNRIHRQVAQLRKSVNWWSRKPIYLDRIDIFNIPEGIDIRRFVDKKGKTIFTVDNPYILRGSYFEFKGQRVNIPNKNLAIILHD